MNTQPNLTLKLALIGIVIIGVFILAGIGKIDATVALGSIVVLVTGLTVALGISGSGAVQAAATLRAANVNPKPLANAVEADAAKIAPLAMFCIVGIFVLAGARSLVGCTPQQGQTAVNTLGPGIAFVGCVWTTYQGIPAGTPIVQVIAQEIQACGGDAVNVATVLDQREAPAMHKTMAHEVIVTTTPVSK